jgi:hypothetical protein
VQNVTQEVPTVFSNGEHVRKTDTAVCGGVSEKGDAGDDTKMNMVQN